MNNGVRQLNRVGNEITGYRRKYKDGSTTKDLLNNHEKLQRLPKTMDCTYVKMFRWSYPIMEHHPIRHHTKK